MAEAQSSLEATRNIGQRPRQANIVKRRGRAAGKGGAVSVPVAGGIGTGVAAVSAGWGVDCRVRVGTIGSGVQVGATVGELLLGKRSGPATRNVRNANPTAKPSQ